MAKKTTYIATAPDGTIIKRGTARTYVAAVLCLSGQTRETATWGQLSFNGRFDLAHKEAKRWNVGVPYCSGDTFFEVIVVPVYPEGEVPAQAEVVAEALEIDAEAEAVVAAERAAEPVTTFYVTRDTDNDRATDEDRAMAHVLVHSGTDLAAAQDALKAYLTEEAGYLTRGRDITKDSDVWAFQRAVALMGIAAEVREMDPRKNPRGYKVASRYAVGLRWSIVAQTR